MLLVSCLIYCYFSNVIKIDREIYFYNHGQRIDVSRVVGIWIF